jgi:hypothetical protein
VAEQWGPTAPFKCSFLLLVIGGVVVQSTWTENYGDQRGDWGSGMKESFKIVWSERKVSMTGFMQSFFESAMFTFVFMWTPALSDTTPFKVLFGWVFSAFMVRLFILLCIFCLL